VLLLAHRTFITWCLQCVQRSAIFRFSEALPIPKVSYIIVLLIFYINETIQVSLVFSY